MGEEGGEMAQRVQMLNGIQEEGEGRDYVLLAQGEEGVGIDALGRKFSPQSLI